MTAAVLFLIGILGSCQKKAPPPAAADDGPMKINIMTRQSSGELPTADNAIIKAIADLTNTDLNIEYIPNVAYREKLSVTVASNTYHTMTLIDTDGKPLEIEVDTVRAGVWWRVGDYLKDYKYLSQLDDTRIANASVDGHLWGLFRFRPAIRDGLYYRKDWADKVGFTDKPRNPEDLYKLAKAFVEKDPSGSGSYGLAQQNGFHLATLGQYYGLAQNYGFENGKLYNIIDKPEYLEMIKWWKRMYDDGLMNKDFPTVGTEKKNEMMAINYGISIHSIDQGWFSIVPLQKVHPEATFVVMTDFPDSKAPIWGRAGFNGKWYVAKQAVPDEKSFRKVMQFMDWLYSPEVNNLIYCGLEGRHFTKVGPNSITISDEQRHLYNLEVLVMEQLGSRYMRDTYKIANNTEYEEQQNYFSYEYDFPTIGDPTWPLSSETYNEIGSTLNQIIGDANTKFVTGAINEAQWKAEMTRWHTAGGDKMLAEYQNEYDTHNK